MESFAQRYCQLNPDIFTNSDTCYVLSFAIIMLNTSLHNPSVKDKPTAEQFISMNRCASPWWFFYHPGFWGSRNSMVWSQCNALIAGASMMAVTSRESCSYRSMTASKRSRSRSRRMTAMTWCTPSSIRTEKDGCGNREDGKMTSMIIIYRLSLIHVYLVFLAGLGLGEFIY